MSTRFGWYQGFMVYQGILKSQRYDFHYRQKSDAPLSIKLIRSIEVKYCSPQHASPDVTLYWCNRQLSWQRWRLRVVWNHDNIATYNFILRWLLPTTKAVYMIILHDFIQLLVCHHHPHIISVQPTNVLVSATATSVTGSTSKKPWKKGTYLVSIHYSMGHKYLNTARFVWV